MLQKKNSKFIFEKACTPTAKFTMLWEIEQTKI